MQSRINKSNLTKNEHKNKQQHIQTKSREQKQAKTNKSNQEGKRERNKLKQKEKKQTKAKINKRKNKQKQASTKQRNETSKQIKYCEMYRALWGNRGEIEIEGHLNPDGFSKRRLAPGHFKQLLYC